MSAQPGNYEAQEPQRAQSATEWLRAAATERLGRWKFRKKEAPRVDQVGETQRTEELRTELTGKREKTSLGEAVEGVQQQEAGVFDPEAVRARVLSEMRLRPVPGEPYEEHREWEREANQRLYEATPEVDPARDFPEGSGFVSAEEAERATVEAIGQALADPGWLLVHKDATEKKKVIGKDGVEREIDVPVLPRAQSLTRKDINLLRTHTIDEWGNPDRDKVLGFAAAVQFGKLHGWSHDIAARALQKLGERYPNLKLLSGGPFDWKIGEKGITYYLGDLQEALREGEAYPVGFPGKVIVMRDPADVGRAHAMHEVRVTVEDGEAVGKSYKIFPKDTTPTGLETFRRAGEVRKLPTGVAKKAALDTFHERAIKG